jgi:hypothetical protein
MTAHTVPQTYYPSPAPVPETPLDAIQRAHRAGALTDTEMLARQDALFAPCIDHSDRPGKFEVHGYMRCKECWIHLNQAGRA